MHLNLQNKLSEYTFLILTKDWKLWLPQFIFLFGNNYLKVIHL